MMSLTAVIAVSMETPTTTALAYIPGSSPSFDSSRISRSPPRHPLHHITVSVSNWGGGKGHCRGGGGPVLLTGS